jgi:hypothetical protein
MICVEKRHEEVGDLARQKRVYKNCSEEYWLGGVKSEFARKIARIERKS